jgi:hypothetical protein
MLSAFVSQYAVKINRMSIVSSFALMIIFFMPVTVGTVWHVVWEAAMTASIAIQVFSSIFVWLDWLTGQSAMLKSHQGAWDTEKQGYEATISSLEKKVSRLERRLDKRLNSSDVLSLIKGIASHANNGSEIFILDNSVEIITPSKKVVVTGAGYKEYGINGGYSHTATVRTTTPTTVPEWDNGYYESLQ